MEKEPKGVLLLGQPLAQIQAGDIVHKHIKKYHPGVLIFRQIPVKYLRHLPGKPVQRIDLNHPVRQFCPVQLLHDDLHVRTSALGRHIPQLLPRKSRLLRL